MDSDKKISFFFEDTLRRPGVGHFVFSASGDEYLCYLNKKYAEPEDFINHMIHWYVIYTEYNTKVKDAEHDFARKLEIRRLIIEIEQKRQEYLQLLDKYHSNSFVESLIEIW